MIDELKSYGLTLLGFLIFMWLSGAAGFLDDAFIVWVIGWTTLSLPTLFFGKNWIAFLGAFTLIGGTALALGAGFGLIHYIWAVLVVYFCLPATLISSVYKLISFISKEL